MYVFHSIYKQITTQRLSVDRSRRRATVDFHSLWMHYNFVCFFFGWCVVFVGPINCRGRHRVAVCHASQPALLHYSRLCVGSVALLLCEQAAFVVLCGSVLRSHSSRLCVREAHKHAFHVYFAWRTVFCSCCCSICRRRRSNFWAYCTVSHVQSYNRRKNSFSFITKFDCVHVAVCVMWVHLFAYKWLLCYFSSKLIWWIEHKTAQVEVSENGLRYPIAVFCFFYYGNACSIQVKHIDIHIRWMDNNK